MSSRSDAASDRDPSSARGAALVDAGESAGTGRAPDRASGAADAGGTRAAVRAVRLQFFVSGCIFATWGVHVPTVKAHFQLGEAALAIAMLASGVGALIALSGAGALLGRHGPRPVAQVTGVVGALCVGLLVAFDGYVPLLALMLLFGTVFALFDVAINVVASDLESRAGRPLMSGLHGMFSVGGMAGAAIGSLLPLGGVAPAAHLAGVTAAAAVLVLVAARGMPRAAVEAGPARPRWPAAGPVLWLGVLAALGLVAEGAMYDWSVLFLREEVGSRASIAALAYASFSAAMAAGRFGGDAVRARLAPIRLFQWSGGLAAFGMALALLTGSAPAALVGFALVGLGLSNIVPVLFSVAGRLPGVASSEGIAGVSAMGYLGMMAGPPMIGFVAQGASLTAGLWTVVVFATVLALSANRALPRA